MAAAAILFGTRSADGCGQTTAPTSPSSVARIASSSGSSARTIAFARSEVEPIVAQLTLVLNLLIAANHQLVLSNTPQSNPAVPGEPAISYGENTLNFYVRANAALDALVLPADPTEPMRIELRLIYDQAAATLAFLGVRPYCEEPCDPPPRPSLFYPEIIMQAQHTIEVVGQFLP